MAAEASYCDQVDIYVILVFVKWCDAVKLEVEPIRISFISTSSLELLCQLIVGKRCAKSGSTTGTMTVHGD